MLQLPLPHDLMKFVISGYVPYTECVHLRKLVCGIWCDQRRTRIRIEPDSTYNYMYDECTIIDGVMRKRCKLSTLTTAANPMCTLIYDAHGRYVKLKFGTN